MEKPQTPNKSEKPGVLSYEEEMAHLQWLIVFNFNQLTEQLRNYNAIAGLKHDSDEGTEEGKKDRAERKKKLKEILEMIKTMLVELKTAVEEFRSEVAKGKQIKNLFLNDKVLGAMELVIQKTDKQFQK